MCDLRWFTGLYKFCLVSIFYNLSANVFLAVLEWSSTFFPYREPRGFAFVQFVDPYDASEAQYHMNRQIFAGREISVVVAEETRKRPEEMRQRTRARYFFLFLIIVWVLFLLNYLNIFIWFLYFTEDQQAMEGVGLLITVISVVKYI